MKRRKETKGRKRPGVVVGFLAGLMAASPVAAHPGHGHEGLLGGSYHLLVETGALILAVLAIVTAIRWVARRRES